MIKLLRLAEGEAAKNKHVTNGSRMLAVCERVVVTGVEGWWWLEAWPNMLMR